MKKIEEELKTLLNERKHFKKTELNYEQMKRSKKTSK
jgi:hypothetical protein